MDRHVRNDEKIPINIDQLRRDALLRLNDYTTGNGKRTIQPWCTEHTAILLDIQLDIAVVHDDLCVRLDLKTGESQWLAMIWNPLYSPSGIRKAMMAESFRVT